MSAYVVEDMIELSQAHATYRFIVCDEEEEKPRLLVSHFSCSVCAPADTRLALALQAVDEAVVCHANILPDSSEWVDNGGEDAVQGDWTWFWAWWCTGYEDVSTVAAALMYY